MIRIIQVEKWQTMQISGETARYKLSHLNLNYLQNLLIAFGSERVNRYYFLLIIRIIQVEKWQTMQISGETARYELSPLNLHCLQNPLITFGSERV